MNNKKYSEMYEQYKLGFSLSQVGKMFGMTRQSVFSGFKRRKYKLRKKEPVPYKFFNEIKFGLRNHGYYCRTDKDNCLMHRYVWEYHNGKIPPKHDIHHIDHDKSNNKIENLELYTKSEHARKFATGHNQFTNENNR